MELREGSFTISTAIPVRATQPVTYQKKADSIPACLRARAIGSAVPPKTAATRACGRPTPSARTLVGNISAFTIAASAV